MYLTHIDRSGEVVKRIGMREIERDIGRQRKRKFCAGGKWGRCKMKD